MKKKQTIKKNNVIIKLIIFAILLILIIVIILNIMARYESEGETIGEIEIALYILDVDYQSMNLKLDSLVPREPPYVYNFSISNHKDNLRTDIELEYTLIIRTTTNLPLIYELYLNETYSASGATNLITNTNNVVALDDDGTYFRTITMDTEFFGYLQDETNLYQLIIYFPETYKSIAYQDIIEGIEINVNSTQVIQEEEPDP